jgi:hypothetical protein
VNRDDGIEVVVFTGENGFRLNALDLLPKGLQFGPQFALNRLALTSQFKVRLHIGQTLSEFVVFFDLLAQTLSGGEDALGRFLALPEIGLGYLLLERVEFSAALGGVKESSAVRWRVASTRHNLFAVRRSRLLLTWSAAACCRFPPASLLAPPP